MTPMFGRKHRFLLAKGQLQWQPNHLGRIAFRPFAATARAIPPTPPGGPRSNGQVEKIAYSPVRRLTQPSSFGGLHAARHSTFRCGE